METFEVPLLLEDGSGRRLLNRDKLGENWFALRADDNPITVAASSKAPSGFSIPEDAGHAGDFEVAGIVGRGVAPFTMQMSMAGVDANSFMNQPVHHNLLLGRAGLPFVLAETLYAPAGSFLSIEVNNLSTALENSIRLALVGRKDNSDMPEDIRAARRAFFEARPSAPYWLTLDQTKAVLTADQSKAEYHLTMPSGSHFVAECLLAESTGPFEIEIYDGHNGRALTMDGGIDSRLLVGSGALPARTLGSPILQPRRSVKVLLTDLSGAANTIYFTMHGRRMRLAKG